jgi:phosphate-selective porin OprO/OprP
MKNKILTTAISSAVIAMSANLAFADTTEDLVNALVTKGVLTEEEGALLSKNNDKAKKNTPIVKNKDGAFSIESADGKNEIALTGRLHFDYHNSDLDGGDLTTSSYDNYDIDAKSVGSEYEVRRARIGVKGKLGGIWNYEIVTNTVGKSANLIDEAKLTFAPSKPFNITAGVFKQAFNLEGATSSNDIDFTERSWVHALSPHKQLGVGVSGEPTKGLTYQLTNFQHGFSEDTGEDGNSNYSARLTYNFAEAMDAKDSIFHVGIAGTSEDYRKTPTTSSNGVATTSTTHARILELKSAGRGYSPLFGFDVEGSQQGQAATLGASAKGKNAVQVDKNLWGVEGIVAKGPFKLQGEYANAGFSADNGTGARDAEFDLKTYYLTAGWILTGEDYASSYSGGKMKGLKSKNWFDFEKGTGTGLWEVNARYAYFKADNMYMDNSVSGYNESRLRGTAGGGSCASTSATYGADTTSGNALAGCSSSADEWTIGLKWIANPNVLVKADYVYTDYDNNVKAPDMPTTAKAFDNEQMFHVRMQYMF